jgi:hypothetical protein
MRLKPLEPGAPKIFYSHVKNLHKGTYVRKFQVKIYALVTRKF